MQPDSVAASPAQEATPPRCANCGQPKAYPHHQSAGPSLLCRQTPTALTEYRAAPTPEASGARERDGQALHDGGIYDPHGCPRGLGAQCSPLSRIASPGFESFMCCGQTNNAPVPTDRLRLCIKSTHASGVDLLVNLDERDTVHTASVLLGGLASLGSVKITATDSDSETVRVRGELRRADEFDPPGCPT